VSAHLDRIIAREGIVNTQVVFVDVEKCSKRKTAVRGAVVKAFNELVATCLDEVLGYYAKQFGDESATAADVVKSQGGDSIALMFTFSAVHDAHFRFAKTFIERLHAKYKSKRCEIFDAQRYCNCCPDLFFVRVGLDDGPAQVFRDINGQYNVIGTVVDMAFRIMNLGDGSQIMMSENTFKHIVDLEASPDLETHSRAYRGVRVKHEVELDVYQYCGAVDGLCDDEPVQLRPSRSLQEILGPTENE